MWGIVLDVILITITIFIIISCLVNYWKTGKWTNLGSVFMSSGLMLVLIPEDYIHNNWAVISLEIIGTGIFLSSFIFWSKRKTDKEDTNM